MKVPKKIQLVLVLSMLGFNCLAQEQKKLFEEPIAWIGLSAKGAVTSGPQRDHVDALREVLKARSSSGARDRFRFPALAKFDGIDAPLELTCVAAEKVFTSKKQFYEMLDREASNPKYDQYTTNRFKFYVEAQRSGVLIRYEGLCDSPALFAKLRGLGVEARSLLESEGFMIEVVPSSRITFVF